MTKTIIFEPTYPEPQLCFCGCEVMHFNKHIKTKVHRKAEKEHGLESVIKKKRAPSKTTEEKKAYMREYMRKYNKENKESYEKRKEKYRKYRNDNRMKCLIQMYKSRERVSAGERKNYKEEEKKEEKK